MHKRNRVVSSHASIEIDHCCTFRAVRQSCGADSCVRERFQINRISANFLLQIKHICISKWTKVDQLYSKITHRSNF